MNSLKVFIHVPCAVCNRAERIAAELSSWGYQTEVIISNRGDGPERKKEYNLVSELAFIILSPAGTVLKLYHGVIPNVRVLARELDNLQEITADSH